MKSNRIVIQFSLISIGILLNMATNSSKLKISNWNNPSKIFRGSSPIYYLETAKICFLIFMASVGNFELEVLSKYSSNPPFFSTVLIALAVTFNWIFFY